MSLNSIETLLNEKQLASIGRALRADTAEKAAEAGAIIRKAYGLEDPQTPAILHQMTAMYESLTRKDAVDLEREFKGRNDTFSIAVQNLADVAHHEVAQDIMSDRDLALYFRAREKEIGSQDGVMFEREGYFQNYPEVLDWVKNVIENAGKTHRASGSQAQRGHTAGSAFRNPASKAHGK